MLSKDDDLLMKGKTAFEFLKRHSPALHAVRAVQAATTKQTPLFRGVTKSAGGRMREQGKFTDEAADLSFVVKQNYVGLSGIKK